MGKCHISLNKNSFAYMTPRPLISQHHEHDNVEGNEATPPAGRLTIEIKPEHLPSGQSQEDRPLVHGILAA